MPGVLSTSVLCQLHEDSLVCLLQPHFLATSFHVHIKAVLWGAGMLTLHARVHGSPEPSAAFSGFGAATVYLLLTFPFLMLAEAELAWGSVYI